MLTSREYFNKYSEFLGGPVGAQPNRLTQRFNKLIRQQETLFSNARVLDLGSHDGRWAVAALEAGARHVTGFEGRQALVDRASEICHSHGITEEKFKFEVGDFHKLLAGRSAGEFDIILCLGVLYHTPHNVLLLQQLGALTPKHIILDTRVAPLSGAYFKLGEETTATPGRGIDAQGIGGRVLICLPTHGAVVKMAEHIGYGVREIQWLDGSVKNWENLKEYKEQKRRSYLLSR